MYFKNLGTIMLAVLFYVVAFPALAVCDASLLQNPVINAPNLSIQRDVPVGALLHSGITTAKVNVKQNGSNSPFYLQGTGPAYGKNDIKYNGFSIFNTSITGLGIAFNASDATNGVDFANTKPGFIGIFETEIEYYFVKTAPIKASMVNTDVIDLSYVCLGDSKGISFGEKIKAIGGSTTVVACSVLNTNISVSFNNVDKRKFAGVGSTAGETSFAIKLDCDATANVNLQIDATPDPGGAPGVIALASAATPADGIGVQIINEDRKPIPLGTTIVMGTALNNGPFDIPLKAHYYQTKTDITPGTANAVANFTLSYN
ncbi:fimbrial protein [Enterobacter sp. C4G1]|uniref:fimbrial protein n=1 Tax=Enterobacter sp. C4G1 TaxID=3458724 RepID=UPI004068F8F7